MKKGLIICLLLVMLFIFSGCGGNEDSKKSNENNGSNKNGNDVCYYYQNKEYKLSYIKSNINNNKIENFDTITINLKDIEGFIDKELVLMEGVKTYLDNLYYSEDFFGVYCGRK